jgi:hypothetical protein
MIDSTIDSKMKTTTTTTTTTKTTSGRLGHVLLARDEWIEDARTVSNTNDEKRNRDRRADR